MATYSKSKLRKIWAKGTEIDGKNPNEWRLDACGALMCRSQYGQIGQDFCWDVDHIEAISQEGENDINNLRPMHILNNQKKADKKSGCAVKYVDGKNVPV